MHNVCYQRRRIKNEDMRFKLRGARFNQNLKSNIFTQRVVGMWNEPLEGVVETGTITTFARI